MKLRYWVLLVITVTLSLVLLLAWQMHRAGEERLQQVIHDIVAYDPQLEWEQQFPTVLNEEYAERWQEIAVMLNVLDSTFGEQLGEVVSSSDNEIEAFLQTEDWRRIQENLMPLVEALDRGPLFEYRGHWLKQRSYETQVLKYLEDGSFSLLAVRGVAAYYP